MIDKSSATGKTKHLHSGRTMNHTRRSFFFFTITFLFLLPHFLVSQDADEGEPAPVAANATAYVVPIHGEINPFRVVFVRRGIQKAETAGADYIIFDIDTFGGRVDSALQITTLIGSAENTKTIAYVPASAEGTGVSWSAGALISLACETIYMAPGTSIGAAAPVYQTQEGMEMAPEKTVSAVRTQMAALAEKNGYPEAVALAMVDVDVELLEVYIDGERRLASRDEMAGLERQARQADQTIEEGNIISKSGKLLTFTAGDMEEYGLSSGTVRNRDALFVELGADEDSAVVLSESTADRAAAFITSAAVTGILVLIGLVALYMEITSPGFGVPGTIAIICFAVVFLGSALLGTVGSIELLMFIAGVILLIVEIFLIPGFGVTGIGGLVLMAAALVLSRQDFIWPEFAWEWDVFRRNLITIGLSVVGSLVFFGVMLRLFPRLPLFNRLILAGPGEGPGSLSNDPELVEFTSGGSPSIDAETKEKLAGATGTAVTTLRPAGKADIFGEIYDVKTEGAYIDRGTEVEVTRVQGNHIMVKKR